MTSPLTIGSLGGRQSGTLGIRTANSTELSIPGASNYGRLMKKEKNVHKNGEKLVHAIRNVNRGPLGGGRPSWRPPSPG